LLDTHATCERRFLMRPRTTRVAAAVTALLLAVAGCSGSSENEHKPAAKPAGPPKLKAVEALGAPEGEVHLLARAGYVENGSTSPKADWVSGFEQQTGCKVSVKVARSAAELAVLMSTGGYDAASVSGDVAGQLINAGTVAPVNTALVPNYADVYDGLKNQPWNSVRGTAYGVPHGRAANPLMWRTDVVKKAPTSWSVVYDENSPYKGRITAYDSPMSLADAALYLMKSRPELRISNPYALDVQQFDATVELARKQHANVGAYWTDYAKQVAAFKSGAAVVGASWQVITNLAQAEKAPVQAAVPAEGTTGWSDTWMLATRARHPNCAYKWFDHIVSPKVNAQAAEWFGQAPANAKSCALAADKAFCAAYHAADEAYYAQVWYWRTPMKQCLDGRPAVCKSYDDWTRAWREIKG
jgi:putative spermidine/putrescine transport system substrate-binding protein